MIIALVVSAASYASFMPQRASSRASGMINPADGLSYSGAVVSENTTAAQSLKVSVANRAGGTDKAAESNGLLGSTTNAGLAANRANQAEVLSAGLGAPNLLSGLNLTASDCDATQSDKYCVYEIKDTDVGGLSQIAENAGLKNGDVLAAELLLHSNKPDIATIDDLLQIGQKLRIPRGQGVLHLVLSDETLSDISDQYDSPLDDILQANGISDANSLKIGDELLIPHPKRFQSLVIVEEAAPAGPQIVGGGPRSDVGFIWPTVGPISSYFGPNHPLGVDIDLFGNGGAPIASAKAGTVSFAGGNPCCSYGYYVVVDHGDGWQTLYAHLSAVSVGVGQRVAQGQLIGYGGSTGYSTGSHLHFEVHRNGSNVNPLTYLP